MNQSELQKSLKASSSIWANQRNYLALFNALEAYGYKLEDFISFEDDLSPLARLLDRDAGIDALLRFEGFTTFVGASLRYNHSEKGGLTLRHNGGSEASTQFNRWEQTSTAPLAQIKPEIYIHALGVEDGFITGRILLVDAPSLHNWFSRLSKQEQESYLVKMPNAAFYSFKPMEGKYSPIFSYTL